MNQAKKDSPFIDLDQEWAEASYIHPIPASLLVHYGIFF